MGARTTQPAEAEPLHRVLSRTDSFQKTRQAVTDGAGTIMLGGVTFSGAALLFSTLIAKHPNRSFFLITPDQQQAEDLYAACTCFAPDGAQTVFFPAHEGIGKEDVNPASVSARLTVCKLLHKQTPSTLIIAPLQAALEEAPPAEKLEESLLALETGTTLDPEALMERLEQAGFSRIVQVERPGDFARRGGILDIFPFGRRYPLRLDFDADELADIREFDPTTQLSRGKQNRVELYLTSFCRPQFWNDPRCSIFSYKNQEASFCIFEEPHLREKAFQLGRHAGATEKRSAAKLDHIFKHIEIKLARYSPPETTCSFAFHQKPPQGDSIDANVALLKGHLQIGWRFFIVCPNKGEQDTLTRLLNEKNIAAGPRLGLLTGSLREGFVLEGTTAVLTSNELLQKKTLRRISPVETHESVSSGFFSIQPGDLVVHMAHGIGRFLKTEWIEKNGCRNEFLVLEFRDKVKLFVPVSKADLVVRYVGGGEKPPALDKLHGTSWFKRCAKVQEAIHDLASEMLEIQAKRMEKQGVSFLPDNDWQLQLEASFPFEDTPDQAESTRKIKADMESRRCMDRLLCGDVGYGKTEIAIRAAFKAVNAGKQVSVLVPTTVLAEQHMQTFSDRLSGFPVTVAVLSRFVSKRKQKEIVERLKRHEIDIVIGTHRLLSKDIVFHDLGLVIIDEEQRFGVMHKERFKRLRTTVDILTMTATPIPRTLHMSLLGLRDISNLETPPEGRAPIRTEVMHYNPDRIREIILRELDRDGQVYYVFNRVRGLPVLKREIERLVPEARVAIAHGQMAEKELAATMRRFLRGGVDVLATTTIIESGLDIQNVNTLIVADADRFGLSDLHQLRGRVGRFRHQAYAYFLLPMNRKVSFDGEKRLRALESFSSLGAGFKLALKDLEIRGTGNILGSQQSGHIAQIGYDMYCKLLKNTVKTLKKEEKRPVFAPDVTIKLRLPAYLPEEFIPPSLDRLDIYRKITQADTEETLRAETVKLKDRFGAPPRPVSLFIDLQVLRVRLKRLQVQSVYIEKNHAVFERSAAADDTFFEKSPFPLRMVEPGVYMFEKPVKNDEEALQCFLSWSDTMRDRIHNTNTVRC